MTRLIQKRALCSNPSVVFGFVHMSSGDDDYCSAQISIPEVDWRDMGEPSEVTVTIQPGDHLNTNPANPHAYASEWRDGDTMPTDDSKANPEFL